MLADILTKPLTPVIHTRLMDMIGMIKKSNAVKEDT